MISHGPSAASSLQERVAYEDPVDIGIRLVGLHKSHKLAVVALIHKLN